MSASLPPRQPSIATANTRAVALDALRTLGLPRLPALLGEVLAQADDALFEFAERAGSSVEQQQFFDAMRELRRERTRIEQRFADHLQLHFGRVAASAAGARARSALDLVDADSLEDQLACEQVSSAAEKRQRERLFQLGNRLRHGAGGSDASPLPAWAAQIADAYRLALGPLALTLRVRLLLYKLFERRLVPAFGSLLDAFDQHLQQAGFALGRPAMPPAPPAAAGRALPPVAPLHRATPNARAAEPAGPAEPGGPAAPGRRAVAVDEELYGMLRDALSAASRWQQELSANPPAQATTRPLPRQAALGALSLLQAAPTPSLLAALDDPQATLADVLSRELLAQARGLGLGDGAATLQEQDTQALALVGMLFDVLLTQRSYLREVRRQFLRLSVPYAKAALLDPRMFALKTHPARRLLDTLTEASDGNQGETSSERELLARVDGVVERLLAEFNEDIAIFAELDAEVRQSLEQHQRRTELAEKRAAEAQRGHERLEQARRHAAAELRALGSRHAIPGGPLGRFLREHWPHHLAMVELRDGADGERYHAARRVGAALARMIEPPGFAAGEFAALTPLLTEVLASNGLHGAISSAALDELHAALRHESRADRSRAAATPADAQPSNMPQARPSAAPGLAPLPPSAQILFHPAAIAAVEAQPMPIDAVAAAEPRSGAPTEFAADHQVLVGEGCADAALPDADPASEDDLARVDRLEVGDWVEFVADDGSAIPAKLSWISPISARLLFVNRRGMRHCVASRDELATQLAQGGLRLRSDDSAFARAMRQVLGRLQESGAAADRHA